MVHCSGKSWPSVLWPRQIYRHNEQDCNHEKCRRIANFGLGKRSRDREPITDLQTMDGSLSYIRHGQPLSKHRE